MTSQIESNELSEKIAVIGISNAGKTSIIKVLVQEFDALTSLKPTQGVEYNQMKVFGKEFMLWDYGGQSVYRTKYLSAPERYLISIKAMFYVVDLQDKANIDESIKYFNLIFDQLQKYSPNVKIIFLFNKTDPEYKDLYNLNENKRTFLNGVVPTVDPAQTQIYMFATSIKNPFSIITAFSQTLFTKKELYIQTSELLKTIVEMYNLGFAILFSKDYFELGNHFSDKVGITDRNNLLSQLFKEYDLETNSIEAISTPGNPYQLMVLPFMLENSPSKIKLLLVLSHEKRLNLGESKLEDKAVNISKNIGKLLSSSYLLE